MKAKVPGECLTRRCKRDGCSVTLKDAPKSHVIIDIDYKRLPIGTREPKCDFIFLSDEGRWVAPIELKKGSPDASQIVGQLRAGAKLAEQIVPGDIEVQFRPIVAYGGRTHRKELTEFRESKSLVSFRTRKVSVTMLKCGDALAKALKDSVL